MQENTLKIDNFSGSTKGGRFNKSSIDLLRIIHLVSASSLKTTIDPGLECILIPSKPSTSRPISTVLKFFSCAVLAFISDS